MVSYYILFGHMWPPDLSEELPAVFSQMFDLEVLAQAKLLKNFVGLRNVMTRQFKSLRGVVCITLGDSSFILCFWCTVTSPDVPLGIWGWWQNKWSSHLRWIVGTICHNYCSFYPAHLWVVSQSHVVVYGSSSCWSPLNVPFGLFWGVFFFIIFYPFPDVVAFHK